MTFTFAGGTPATQTATTDINGVATATTTFAAVGSHGITASYTLQSGELNDAGLLPAEVASVIATINSNVPTTLSPITPPSSPLVGNLLTMSTTLSTAGGVMFNGSR